MPVDELKNRNIDPNEVWRLLGQCELTATRLRSRVGTRLHPAIALPPHFLSDRGPEFVCTVCRSTFRMLGAVKRFTSSANAQTNGMLADEPNTVPDDVPPQCGQPDKLG